MGRNKANEPVFDGKVPAKRNNQKKSKMGVDTKPEVA
jgi:hypothetical protein